MFLITVFSGIFYVSTFIYSTGEFKGKLFGTFNVKFAIVGLSIFG